MSELRDYQREAVDKTVAASRRGLRSVLFVCPTGGGKSHVFAELARLAHERGVRTLVLTDRLELVEQAARQIERLAGLRVGFEQGMRRTGKRPPDVVCATIQSFCRANRLRRFAPGTFGLVVVDEADLGVAPSYRTVLGRFPDAFVFGCTATPDRADGQTLGDVFQEIVHRVDMGDLIRAGHLSPLRRHLVRIESVSLEKVRVDDDDFSDSALEKILIQERALHEVVRPTLDLAGARPSLAFTATVAHAEALAAMFNRYRPGCARMMHGGMGTAERTAILDAYKRREFQFLCNCALLLRGIDLPFVSCIVGARPTLSRALYAQSIGRGTRVCEGKPDLLVLDFTDNSTNHDLISPIDVLAPAASEEAKERAREILDEEQDGDPLEVVERARAELEADPALRERVRAKVAFRLRGVESAASKAARGIDWDAQPLGEKMDTTIAADLGVAPSSVRNARRIREIPRYRAMPDDRPLPMGRKSIDWDALPLGKKKDAEIAQALGVTTAYVCVARNARGIPPFYPQLTPRPRRPFQREHSAESIEHKASVHAMQENGRVETREWKLRNAAEEWERWNRI